MALVSLAAPGGKTVLVDPGSVTAIRDADRPEGGAYVLLTGGATVVVTTSPADTQTALGL